MKFVRSISNPTLSRNSYVLYMHTCRSALEVMRLIELLLVLIMDGRKSLPKSTHPVMGVSKRMDSFTGDRSHRQIIESVRSGNNEDFFEAMENGEH